MRNKPPKDRFLTLTDREKDVLRLVCKQYSYQEIADELFISINTVKKHMFNTYNKLELHDLKKTERILAIHNVYCPMFSEVDESKEDDTEIEIIDVTPEPEPLSPDEEEIIDGDEMALITYTPEPIIGGKEKMGTKKKRSCVKYIFVLILGVLLTLGAWQGWQYVKDIPIVSSIIELIDPGVSTETQSEASSENKSELSTIAEPIISSIQSALGSSVDAYEIGDWVKKDDVWVRLFDYEVSRGYINLDFEVWNKSSKDVYFSWEAEKNFSMTDNKNNRYRIFTDNPREVQVESDERLEITGYGHETVAFKDDPLFKSGVTDLYVKMEYFSTIDEAVFHIVLGD